MNVINIIGKVLVVLGFVSVMFAMFGNLIASIVNYGFAEGGQVIYNWFVWFYLGVIPALIGMALASYEGKKKNKKNNKNK